MEYLEYWIKEGLSTITPADKENPEGFDLGEILNYDGMVLEFGCGIGRLARHFDPMFYVGVDINPKAIEKARERAQAHDFRVTDLTSPLPQCDVALLYTVCLHIPDDRLYEQLRRVTAAADKRVVIAEIMNPKFRRKTEGGDYTFANQREPMAYVDAMESLGWHLDGEKHKKYAHYKDEYLTILEFAHD